MDNFINYIYFVSLAGNETKKVMNEHFVDEKSQQKFRS